MAPVAGRNPSRLLFVWDRKAAWPQVPGRHGGAGQCTSGDGSRPPQAEDSATSCG